MRRAPGYIPETGRQGTMRACLDLLAAEKVRHWRMNSGTFPIFGEGGKVKRVIKGQPTGTPDILAALFIYRRDRLLPEKAVVWVETKSTGKKQTPEQKEFQVQAEAEDEIYLLIADPQQLIDWLHDNRARAR